MVDTIATDTAEAEKIAGAGVALLGVLNPAAGALGAASLSAAEGVDTAVTTALVHNTAAGVVAAGVDSLSATTPAVIAALPADAQAEASGLWADFEKAWAAVKAFI